MLGKPQVPFNTEIVLAANTGTVCAGVFVVSIGVGVWRGLVREVLAILGWVIAFLAAVGIQVVVVHGGGKAITRAMDKAGLKMPDAPTWDFIIDAANRMTDRANGVSGICLRGKAGWGENMAFLSTLINTNGGRWFDELGWDPQVLEGASA